MKKGSNLYNDFIRIISKTFLGFKEIVKRSKYVCISVHFAGNQSVILKIGLFTVTFRESAKYIVLL